jgi:carbonic anhydrase
MSDNLQHLLDHNRRWAAQIEAERPGFFTKLSQQQSPRYMWIGCSDSRVPANQITGLDPGEVFVHRNVANVVVPTDLNCLSTVQFAVDVLKVEHLMVVGHYGCGGVLAALRDTRVGLADNWLRHINDALCELNVIEQVMNTVQTTVVQDAWDRGQAVTLHGWVYGLKDGLLQDLFMTVRGNADVDKAYRKAVAEVGMRQR